jgi:outer membrane protein TolC
MKKKWMITGCILLMVITVGSGPVIAQENIPLGISQMITLAISNNLNFKKASYQLENVELDAKQLAAENLLTESGMAAMQKEISLLQQQDNFRRQKDQLIIKVVDDYFQLMMSEKDVARKEKNVELERIVLEEVEAQVAAGYSVDLDLLQQGNSYYDSLFSYEKAKLNQQQLLIEVKNTLGIDYNQEVVLSEIQILEFPEIDITESLAKARENNLSLKSKDIETELTRIRLEKAKIDQAPELGIVKLENNFGIAQLERSLLEQDLDYQVLTQWQNYSQSKNDITLSQQSLKQMEENESIINRQVQVGLRSEDESLSAAIGVLDAEYRLISSVRQYYQSYLELQRMMGIMDEGEIK